MSTCKIKKATELIIQTVERIQLLEKFQMLNPLGIKHAKVPVHLFVKNKYLLVKKPRKHNFNFNTINNKTRIKIS